MHDRLARSILHVLTLCAALFLGAAAQAGDYPSELARWQSYRDVAQWLDQNFTFDQARLQTILGRVRESGPSGLLARPAAATYERKNGYCTDSAYFAVEALNAVNPDYKARLVFIKNRYGPVHHWVTGFNAECGIMIMDYGTGPEWRDIRGLHGPYQSLNEYAEFLTTRNVKRFAPESVEWRPKFPGQIEP